MKELLKKILVPALSRSPVSALAESIFGRAVPVFMIHRMAVEGLSNNGISPDHLRNCLRYLTVNGYTFVSLEEIILSLRNRVELPEKAVAFTMDDGFFEQGSVAAPIFLEFNCPLTFFVVTGLLDKTLWTWDAKVSWIIDNSEKNHVTVNFEDEKISIILGDKKSCSMAREKIRNIIKEMDAEDLPRLINRLSESAGVVVPEAAPACYQPLNWDMARKLESQGVQFAPHSETHRILSKLRKQTAEEEIIGSWETLERELSEPLKVFCYPTGRILDFGPREIEILKKENFLGAVSTVPGYIEDGVRSDDIIFRIPRLVVPDNMVDFIQYCSWIEHAKIFR